MIPRDMNRLYIFILHIHREYETLMKDAKTLSFTLILGINQE